MQIDAVDLMHIIPSACIQFISLNAECAADDYKAWLETVFWARDEKAAGDRQCTTLPMSLCVAQDAKSRCVSSLQNRRVFLLQSA